jgi:hypothetical protein
MKWRVADLIDFEYLLNRRLHREEEHQHCLSNEEDREEDRKIYLDYSAGRTEPFDRKKLFRYWLKVKREGAEVLPGAVALEAIRLFTVLLAFLAAVLGAAVCSSLLAYAGKEPVNVFTCLWVMIAPQLLLLLLLALHAVFAPFRSKGTHGLIYSAISRRVRRLVERLMQKQLLRLSADERLAAQEAVGLVGKTRTVYGKVLFRPVFVTAQVFGIFYNIGLAGALFLRVSITDLAFGWQSTLQPAPYTVHAIVEAIAKPWSWMVPDAIAHPSLSQIEGSRFVYTEGMGHLQSADLTAWWPFLLLTVAFYGLLPRLAIFAATIWRQKRALRRLSFSHAACDRLLLSMKTPDVTTRSRRYSPPPEAGVQPADAGRDLSRAASWATTREQAETAVVLVPEEITGEFSDQELAEALAESLGLDILRRISCDMDPERDAFAIAGFLPETGWNGSGRDMTRLVLLQEAWQPPIRETLDWVRQIRMNAANDLGFIIALIGKPRGGRLITRPADTDRMIWERAVAGLGDPYIRTETLGE